MTRKNLLSLVAIATVLLLGVVFLVFGILRVDPFATQRRATIKMSASGGLAVTSPVLLTGYEIGEVTAIRVGVEGVEVDLVYDAEHRIPADSTMTVETLSALGEPYVEFAPSADGGPYLTDGAVVDTRDLEAPQTISETAASTVAMLEQFDPKVVAGLVDTLTTALAGTDSVMPRLQRSTTLLAETLMAHNPQLLTLLANLQAIGGDLEWLGPTLEEGGPAWASLGSTVIEPLAEQMSLLVEKRDPSVYVTGDGVVPFLNRVNELLVRIGPELAPLAPMLSPVVAAASSEMAQLDIGELVTRALRVTDADGVLRVQLSVQQHGRN